MCIGIVGFFVFWIVLLSKMYLPDYIWDLEWWKSALGAGGTAGSEQEVTVQVRGFVREKRLDLRKYIFRSRRTASWTTLPSRCREREGPEWASKG